MKNEEQVSVKEILYILTNWYHFLKQKIVWLFLAGLIGGVIGVFYAWIQKPTYTAEITFTAENEGSGDMNGYASIAAQFGVSLGLGSGGSAFEGDNLMHLITSRKIIINTLFTSVVINNEKDLLINYYIKSRSSRKFNQKAVKDSNIVFTNFPSKPDRRRDSLLILISKDLSESLVIDKIDKRADIISVKIKDEDELFAKAFVEELMNNVIEYYTDYKIKKIRQNVSILQRQTDSIRSLINGNIVDIAVSSDLNVNPTRQIVRAGIQRKQVDGQVNSVLYTELVKNLELSKLTLRKETPLVQIIDTPLLPLQKKKLGRLMGALIFGMAAAFLTSVFFLIKRKFSTKTPVAAES